MTTRRSFLKTAAAFLGALPLVRLLPKSPRIGMIIPGQWHHIARSIESGRETLYLDGVEVDEIRGGLPLKIPEYSLKWTLTHGEG